MIRISVPKTLISRRDGFTLIEMMVVIGLIAMIMAVAVPNVGLALRANLDNSNRELATIIRATHDEAVLKGQVYRMAFDLDKRQYWAEVGDRDFLMRSSEQEDEEKRRQERRNDEEKAKFKDPFQLATALTKNKKSLPKGVKFSDIQTSRSKEPLKTGLAYAHVFPHGFIEKLVIHLKDDFERESTMVVNPVTGKSRLFNRYVKELE